MSSTLVDNLGALERRFGQLLAGPAPDGPGHVRQSATAAGPSVEVAAGDGRWLRLVSAHNPAAEAARWADDTLLIGEPPVVILIGAALGYVLDEIDRRGAATRVVILEPEPALARMLLERRDWRPWIDAGRLVLLSGPDYPAVSAVARMMEGVGAAPIHLHPVLARVWPGPVKQALAAAERLRFESGANAYAKRAMAGRYVQQTLGNATRLAREGDAASLAGIASGVPAVIAAAGPSLDRNLHDIHAVRDRALLIACDTAARPLLSLGVEPQLVVALDPSVANACHLSGLHQPRRTWLVAEASLHASAFGDFDGRTFFFRVGDHAPWPWLWDAGVDRLRLDVWGSVVTAAFDLAVRMGCSPIVFAGADLAFTGGRPYCRGTTQEAQWASWVAGGESYENVFGLLTNRWPSVTEADVHGQPARTAAHLVAFRDWLASRARALEPGRVINATGDGILLGPAIEQATAVHALAGRTPLDVHALDDRLRAAHRPRGSRSSIFERIADIDRGGWRLPEAWLTPEGSAEPDELRAALEGPEYAAWTLGRTASAGPTP